ncbi:MAG TPA: hypothetical protein VKH44_08135, partial [Pirellulaceae bacterium]|nr:hypothetical protein [Pirellulaceae bacterium]
MQFDTRLRWLLFIGVVIGCSDGPGGGEPTAKRQPKTAPVAAKVVPPNEERPAKAEQPVAAKKAVEPARAKARSVGRTEEMAVKKVTTAIKDSLEIGTTLVVWIIDRT